MKEALHSLDNYLGEIKNDFDEVVASYKYKNQLNLKKYLKQSQNNKNNKNYTLLDYLPYRTYDAKNCMFENNNTIGFIMRVSHFSGIDEAAKQAIHNLINNDLPAGCTLQIINYASPKIGNLLDFWQYSGNKDDKFKKICEERRKFFENGSFNSLLNNQENLIVRDYELYFIFSIASSNSQSSKQADIFSLKALQDKFGQFFKELNSSAYVLNEKDFANFLQEIIKPSKSLYKNLNLNRKTQRQDIREYLQSSHKIEMHLEKVTFSRIDDSTNHDTYSEVIQNETEEQSKENTKKTKNIKIEDSEVNYTIFEVVDWPSHWDLHSSIDYVGDFEKGTGLPCPFFISMGYSLDERGASERSADKNRMIKTQQNDSKLPMFFPKMIEENDDWRYVSNLIGRGERMGKLVMYIVLINYNISGDNANVEKTEQHVKDHFARLEFNIQKIKYDTLNSLVYSLPFSIGENWQILDQLKIPSKKLSGACINLMPVFADSQNYTSPLMLFVGRRGQLFFFDNFKTADSINGNFNMIVVGASGRGKSVWLQEYSNSLLRNGGQVVIIDDGRSFESTCEGWDGDFVDFGGGEFCINPFSLYKRVDENEDTKEYKENFEEPFIDLIVSILCIITNIDKNNTLDPQIGLYRSVLTNAVIAVMNNKGHKGGFSDIRQELLTNTNNKNEATREIINKIEYILRSYSDNGRYAKYFNGRATIDIRNKFTVFELSDLEHNEILQSSALLTVTFLVYAKIRGRNTPTALIIDEFWRTGKHPVLKGPIGGFSRRGRKYNLALIVASQCMSDFEAINSEAGAIALSQSDWRIILSVDGKDDKILRNELKMSTAEIEITHSLKGKKGAYSEFMLRHQNNSWQIGRLILDPYSAQTYSSKAEDIAAIKEMRKKGLSVDEAIEDLIAKKHLLQTNREMEIAE